MKLKPAFYSEVMRILVGEYISPTDSDKMVERLESVEEFFAWMLLRRKFAESEIEVSNCIAKRAHGAISRAETRRKMSSFPIEEQSRLCRLESVLLDALRADQASTSVMESANRAIRDFDHFK